MLSGMESSRKSISVCSFKYKNWWKLLGPGIKIKDINIKIKDINIKFIYKLLVKIKSWYIWFGLHIKIFKKPQPQFHVLEAWKMALFDWTTLWKFLIFIIWFSWGKTEWHLKQQLVNCYWLSEKHLWLPKRLVNAHYDCH